LVTGLDAANAPAAPYAPTWNDAVDRMYCPFGIAARILVTALTDSASVGQDTEVPVATQLGAEGSQSMSAPSRPKSVTMSLMHWVLMPGGV
jgi:hypothetical protein